MKFKKILKKTIAVIASIVAIVGVTVPFTAMASKNADIDVSLTYGYNGMLELGCNSPFTITLKNNGADFDGSVWLLIPAVSYNLDEVFGYEKKISLAAGSSKTLSIVAEIPTLITNCIIKITDSKGKTVFLKNYTLSFDTANSSARIAILSDDYNAFSFLSGKPLDNSQNISLITSKFNENNLLDDHRALDVFEIMIISDFSTDRLSTAQRKAILDWTSNGGLLIIGTGTGAQKVLKGFPELSDIKASGLHTVSTRFGLNDLAKPTVINYFGGFNGSQDQAKIIYAQLPKDLFESEKFRSLSSADEQCEYLYSECRDLFLLVSWPEYYGSTYSNMASYLSKEDIEINEKDFYEYCLLNVCPEILAIQKNYFQPDASANENVYYTAQICDLSYGQTLINGEIKDSSVTYPFACTNSFGKGNICVLAADISKDPFITSDCAFPTFSYLISLFCGEKLAEDYNQGIYSIYGHNNDYMKTDFASALSFGNLIPAPALFLIFTAYTILGFVAYFFLKKRNRSILLWGVQIALAISATVLVLICSLATRINRPTVNAVKISEVSDIGVNESVFASVILPKNKHYVIDFDKAYTPQLLREYSYRYNQNPLMNNQSISDHTIAWLDREGSNAISLSGSAALSSEQFAFFGTKPIEGYEIDLSAQYDVTTGKLSGHVINNTDKTLENCSVLMDYLVYRLGTITPGSKVDLSKITPESIFKQTGYTIYAQDDVTVKKMLGTDDNTDRFLPYFFGFSNERFKLDYLSTHVLEYLLDTDTGLGKIATNMYEEYTIPNHTYGSQSPYNLNTLAEVYEYFYLTPEGHPQVLVSTPYLVAFNEESPGTILADSKNTSENLLEIILVPAKMQ